MSSLVLLLGVVAGAALAAGVAWLMVSRRRLTADIDRFAGFMEHGPFLAFIKDADGRYVYENRALAEHMARSRPGTKTILGRTDAEVFDDPQGRDYVDHDRIVIRHGRPLQFDEVSVDADGTVRHWSTIKFPRLDDRGRTCVAGISIDVTALRSAADEITRRGDILRRLIDVQENERQTLCHELHDGLIQYAIAAKMQLESVRDEADPAVRVERIDAALDCLERGIAEGRQVIRGVRPAVLDDLGLEAAIADLVDQVAVAGIAVTAKVAEGLDAVPAPLQTTIYRVVQEALTNVRKHAGTGRATIDIDRGVDEVHVSVRDRGPGFDVEEARRRGFGLVGMTERVRLAGGTFQIDSLPGTGTQVSARLPLPVSGAEPDAEPPQAEPADATESSPPPRLSSV